MIIVNLFGGLGNQMFQYACGRALAAEQRHELLIRTDMIGGYASLHDVDLLRVFALNVKAASDAELRNMIGVQGLHPAARRILAHRSMAILRARRYICEPYYRYWPELMERAHNGAYLHGYWQSERYFHQQAHLIRTDFEFRLPKDVRNRELLDAIRATPSVGVHIRRGDYVANPRAASTHGTCSVEYYRAALAYLQSRVLGMKLFAFSDDIEWTSDVLRKEFSSATVVGHNRGPDSHIDMHLLSACKHQVIANSSFSWWAAWLNRNPDKVVIAPRKWFVKPIDTTDLAPADWLLM